MRIAGNPGLRQGKPGSGFGIGYGIRFKTQLAHIKLDYAINAFQQKTVYFGISNLVIWMLTCPVAKFPKLFHSKGFIQVRNTVEYNSLKCYKKDFSCYFKCYIDFNSVKKGYYGFSPDSNLRCLMYIFLTHKIFLALYKSHYFTK